MVELQNDLIKIFDKDLNTYNPDGSLNLDNKNLVNLKGVVAKEIEGDLYCRHNKLTTLEHCPKIINGVLNVKYNSELKNVKQQIIENQIEAIVYYTDEGDFRLQDIKKEFLEYREKLKKIEESLKKNKYKNEKLKERKKISSVDYGLSI